MGKLNDLFNEVMSKDKDFTMRNNTEFPVQYPTGILPLDFANGERVHVYNTEKGLDYKYNSIGITDGSYNLFIGRSGSGKSTMAVQAGANIIRNFPDGEMYIDSAEGGISYQRLETLTGFDPIEMKEKVVLKNTGISIENMYKRIKTIYDIKLANPDDFRYDTGLLDAHGDPIIKFQPTVYIIDSIAMLMPQKNTEEEELSGQMAASASARLLTQTLSRVLNLCKTANIIILAINHIREKMQVSMFPKPGDLLYLKPDETLPGGKAVTFYANNIFKISDSGKMAEGKDLNIFGSTNTVEIVKSRTCANGTKVPLIFDQNLGFDPDLSLYLMLKEAGYVKGAGAYLYIGEMKDVKFAQKNFKSTLYTNEEFAKYVYNVCAELLNAKLDKNEKYIEDNKFVRSDSGNYGSTDAILHVINNLNMNIAA